MCYCLNACAPPRPSSYVEILVSSVMVLGGGDFERLLGLDETVSIEPS